MMIRRKSQEQKFIFFIFFHIAVSKARYCWILGADIFCAFQQGDKKMQKASFLFLNLLDTSDRTP
jgi:hypothetical protein